ncbi:MAG: flagellar hook-length control protein FliK [Desulfobacteraceae bacterium]|nr:flagellar hook-length control protein FliK [Desulfobacteraceae bacterium]
MTFNCMDINSSFLKMLKFGKSGDALSGFNNFSKEGILFKEQFASMLQSGQFQTTGSKGMSSIFDKLIAFVSKELKGLQGTDFMEKLKEFFMMVSGNNLTDLSINAEGLDALKGLLVSAGFEIEQVTEMIDDLKLIITEENKNISVSELINKIAEIDVDNKITDKIEEPEQDAFIPMSALPFIESIMTSLGIPEDVRNSIFSDAKTDKGIDLNILIKNLKEVEEKTFATHTYFKTDINANGVAKLMSQLNLGNGSKALLDGKLSLQDFINILENKRNEILSVENKIENNLGDIFAKTVNMKEKETLFENPIRNIKPKPGHANPLITADISATGTTTEEEKKNSGLIDSLFKNLNKQEINNDKIVKVPLNQFNNKDIEKLFPFYVKAENGKDVQMVVKSELEEKVTKFIAKLESSMNGKNDSESRNFFQKGKHQSSALKMPDSFQSTNGEGKILNSVRYLSSAKKETTRTLPSYVTNQIGRSIVRAVNQGQNQIQIQLKPPELGRMMITIQDLGNGVKVSVVAENQAARDILMSNSNNLKDALASSGISLENFDVEMGTNFNQSMRDAKNQAGYSKNKKGFGNEVGDGENMKIRNKDFLREQHLTHDGILYYVA